MKPQQMTATQAQALLNQAIIWHQRGQLQQARTLYERIIAAHPKHYQALHLLGIVAAQTRNFQAAADLIGLAIEQFPNNPDFYINRGNALRELAQFDAAIVSYDKAIAIKPGYAEAYSNRSIALQGLKQLDAAVAGYDKAIALNPAYVEAYSNRGIALLQLKQVKNAIASCDKAIAINPSYVEAHFNRGNALFESQQLEAAVESYDRAIAIRPDYPEAHFGRGVAMQALKRLDDAVACYERAIGINPLFAHAYFNRGLALHDLSRLDAALASFEKAIDLNPDYVEAFSHRGSVLVELKQYGPALASCEKAIALDPDFAEGYFNRGNAFIELKQMEEAIACYDQAISIRPAYAEAYSNRGVALHELSNLHAAAESYDKAIAISPSYAEAFYNKSLALLLSGTFRPGWDLYEWRWKAPKNASRRRNFAQPLWLGEQPIRGKTILLHSEQGLGDTIQFCRYATLVAAIGARVILEVPGQLIGLLNSMDGVAEVIPTGAVLPSFDYHCPLLSLPLAFKTDATTIPSYPWYLRSDEHKVRDWAIRLGATHRPRVGIVWSGSTGHAIDFKRSISLATLTAVLPDGLDYVSLQKEVRDSDQPVLELDEKIRHFGDDLNDFSDTAALCKLMDVVISVDTSVAHLSASLGRQTWVLLPFVPDWRWLMNRDDSPWYPTAKLFRQEEDRDWGAVLDRVQAELSVLVA